MNDSTDQRGDPRRSNGAHPAESAGVGGPDAAAVDHVVQSQRRQRNALIGLAVGSGLVLFIGIVAFLISRSGSGPSETVQVTEVPTSATASTTSSTSTTSTTSTTAPVVAEPIADAGDDLAVSAGEVVTLSAAAVTEGVDDDAVMWQQVEGPDVTAGVGALGGSSVSFGAPDDVVTLRFQLVVAHDVDDEPATDEIVVRVFEDAERALFVDAETGDDAADGSMEAPLKTIAAATARSLAGAGPDGVGDDIYLRSAGTYDESDPIRLGPGMSLIGGFDERWMRDRSARATVNGASIGIIVRGDGDRRVAAIELTTGDAAPGTRAIAIRIDDAETVRVEDSRLVSGRGGDGGGGDGDRGGDVSVGVLATNSGAVVVVRSTVNGGRGGNGGDGAAEEAGASDAASNGEDASGSTAGDGGDDGVERSAGGDGGAGGDGDEDGADGEDSDSAPGGDGGSFEFDADRDGLPGAGGVGGSAGDGGDGGVLADQDENSIDPVGAPGTAGRTASPGAGGGGGGGGAGVDVGNGGPDVGGEARASGGGGGGGGAGGIGGVGGDGGGGGAGSIGIWAVDVDRVVIRTSLVAGGRGGDGGNGFPGRLGGAGASGGDGDVGASATAPVVSPDATSSTAGRGGGGGGGGAGGVGGEGGGGAGGPSFGLLTTDVDDVEILSSTVRGGGGGDGAAGGRSGVDGLGGSAASGRSGGGGGVGVEDGGDTSGRTDERGVGASGGSSYGWFDESGAVQTFEGAEFLEGAAGRGGNGSIDGKPGTQTDANV